MSLPSLWAAIPVEDMELSSALRGLTDLVNRQYMECFAQLERKILSACLARENKVIERGVFDPRLKITSYFWDDEIKDEDRIYYVTWNNELVAAFTLPHMSVSLEGRSSVGKFTYSFLELPLTSGKVTP